MSAICLNWNTCTVPPSDESKEKDPLFLGFKDNSGELVKGDLVLVLILTERELILNTYEFNLISSGLISTKFSY